MTTLREKMAELAAEFRQVMAGRYNLFDLFLPPLLFAVLSQVTLFRYAMAATFVLAVGTAVRRWRQGRPVLYSLGGLVGLVLAIALAQWFQQAELFFLPGIFTGGLTILVGLVSVLIRRPMVAWTSFLARRWPWDWYWHPRVRPAYTETTWLWILYFSLRLFLQLRFYQEQAAESLAVLNAALGWPGTIALLVVTYLYGLWRLQHLAGPSVEEFNTGAEPPWEGQKRGF